MDVSFLSAFSKQSSSFFPSNEPNQTKWSIFCIFVAVEMHCQCIVIELHSTINKHKVVQSNLLIGFEWIALECCLQLQFSWMPYYTIGTESALYYSFLLFGWSSVLQTAKKGTQHYSHKSISDQLFHTDQVTAATATTDSLASAPASSLSASLMLPLSAQSIYI